MAALEHRARLAYEAGYNDAWVDYDERESAEQGAFGGPGAAPPLPAYGAQGGDGHHPDLHGRQAAVLQRRAPRLLRRAPQPPTTPSRRA